MPQRRASHSFSGPEVNVLAAMLECAQNEKPFQNPEDTETFQSVAVKIAKLKAKVSS
jgi:hypothetical protein